MNPTRMETLALFAILILIWGLGWPINKIGLDYISPIWLSVLRQVVAAVALSIYLVATSQFKLPPRQDLPIVFSSAILFACGFITLINFGLLYVHAGRAAILAYTTSFWIIPLAWLFFREKQPALKLIGFLFGMAGILVLFNPWNFNWHDRQVLFGNGLLLLAALCWALVILHARQHRWKSTPLQLAPWQSLLAAILLTFLARFVEPLPNIHWTSTLLFVLIYLGIGASGIGFVISLMISRRLPPLTTSVGLLAIPIVSIIASAIILQEKITGITIFAILLISIGLVCVAYADKNNEKIKLETEVL